MGEPLTSRGCIVLVASSLVSLITTSHHEFVAQHKDLVQTSPLSCSNFVYILMINPPKCQALQAELINTHSYGVSLRQRVLIPLPTLKPPPMCAFLIQPHEGLKTTPYLNFLSWLAKCKLRGVRVERPSLLESHPRLMQCQKGKRGLIASATLVH